MKNFCILSDFDGTITEKDGLYTFIQMYANSGWEVIEENWSRGKISSKECLIEEFKLIPNLTPAFIDNFIQNYMVIDRTFIEFHKYVVKNNIDFYIVSDGCDYFINKILTKYNLSNINVISNHGEFIDNEFCWQFPNDSKHCINNAGTCKCEILKNLKSKYNHIYYIGDGVSDYCVANKADTLFAKKRLIEYCNTQNIEYNAFNDFNDILQYFQKVN